MTNYSASQTGYAPVNGLEMYYEMFGEVLREQPADGPAQAGWCARNRLRATSLADTLVDLRTTCEVWSPKKGVFSA